MTVLQQIQTHRVVAILRGCDPAHILPIAEALYAGGIRLLEITLNSRDALAVIRTTSTRLGDQLLIGAGTVLSPDEAASAIDSCNAAICSTDRVEQMIPVETEDIPEGGV